MINVVLVLYNNIELLRAVSKRVKSIIIFILFNSTSRFINVIFFQFILNISGMIGTLLSYC